jgi:RND superfamily putative drug exporter
VQERIGLGEITLQDERKPSEKVPEQLDESLAFGTVLGAPAWRKPVHDPSRPTAAALAPAGAATGVALAERPPGDGEAASEEALLAEELTIGDIEDAQRDGAGDDESPTAADESSDVLDEPVEDVDEPAEDLDREADEADADDAPAKD